MRILAEESASAIEFLEKYASLNMSVISYMGGQTYPRSHRAVTLKPANVGSLLTNGLEQYLNKYKQQEESEESKRFHLLTQTKVTKLLTDSHGAVVGVEIRGKDSKKDLHADAVIIAAGGFSSSKKLLGQYAPDLVRLPSTNGEWATGDGIMLAEQVHAKLVDMQDVQVHPTGLVDPNDPLNPTKFLGGEALRGSGGMLLEETGKRFVDELSYRDFVSAQIFKHCKPLKVDLEKLPKREGATEPPVVAYLVINQAGASKFEEAIKFYSFKKLCQKVDSAKQLVEKFPSFSLENINKTFEEWNECEKGNKKDPLGRKFFGVLYRDDEPLYVMLVTPSIHYTMGGLAIDCQASVVDEKGKKINNLYAAGEVTGGIHGANRLGGNSLLECIVFGRIAAKTALK